jgi:hypothetical protein
VHQQADITGSVLCRTTNMLHSAQLYPELCLVVDDELHTVLCRPMLELLFARLSPDLRLFAIKKLGRFAAETSLASMHEEVKTLSSAAARGDAAATVEHVLLPLTRQLEAELPSIQSATSGHLSKVWKAAQVASLSGPARWTGCAYLQH